MPCGTAKVTQTGGIGIGNRGLGTGSLKVSILRRQACAVAFRFGKETERTDGCECDDSG